MADAAELGAKLAAAIRANRDDPAPRLVYADWLTAQGHPLGEYIALQLATRDAARADAILAALGLPPPDLATIGWDRGLVRTLRLENDRDWMDSDFDPIAEIAAPLFGHPACVALEELRVGILRWDENYRDVPALLAAAAAQPWAADLVRLELGAVPTDVDMAHHVVGDVGAVIARGFPGLRELKIHSGDQSWRGEGETFGLAGLALPGLASLVIETCAMSEERLAALLAAPLPALRQLELWFGGEESFAHVAPLRPLLDGDAFPLVTELGVRNAQFTDELCAALPASAVAARVRSLDLSMGQMTDDGAAALAAGASAFAALRTLSVDDNFLTPAGLAALRDAFPGVTVVSEAQKEPDTSVPGETYRYVSVHE